MTITPPPAETPPTARGRIRNYFLTGLIVAGPVAITFWLIWSFVTWVDDLLRPIFPVWMRPETYLPVQIPGLGLIFAFIALTLLGFLTANFIGRKFVDLGDAVLERMPIVRPLYRGLKQVFETLFSQSGSSFRKVGLIEFPAPGMWSIVFISTPPSPELNVVLPGEDEYISVFLPCTPNPTTGFFIYVKRKEVIELDVPVEDAAKLIMTAGMIQPTTDPAKAVATMAEQAKVARTARVTAPAK
ncbi:hypothetical protein GJW-30_1_03191 [Variibacter gotjawalensis]|uniref:DUF502 domain-containing protein n=1 Tax=Variibacter gotjawalensis TaxID=1333996 RepID=A0A0S3PXL9_9BRAD|nr:DUF502 domain-containing protein [Variibacter gotjawalensis]NIK46475.1 putative membrane protein [Variibacter gotjawalensis]RZS48384.1 putative membrane protein [Variibacter gotjawalensis]BAT60643.1 hypothetical protein GJW-30_1_03191 [Variibacter gotjawalensis]